MKKQLILKHDIAANWAKAVNFIPKSNELILYDGVMEDGIYIEFPQLKCGDGKTKLNDLPFITATQPLEIISIYDSATSTLKLDTKGDIVKCQNIF